MQKGVAFHLLRRYNSVTTLNNSRNSEGKALCRRPLFLSKTPSRILTRSPTNGNEKILRREGGKFNECLV